MLEECADVDYKSNVNVMKFLSNFVFILFDTTINWKINQQHMMELSTTHVEYIALIEGNESKNMIGRD